MKSTFRLIIYVLIFTISSTVVLAIPSINSVSLNTTNIGTYYKLELTVGLTAAYANPFDPAQVDLKSVFVSPSLSQYTVCGFWDGSQWRVRFAANTAGTWNYTLYLTDSTGAGTASTTGNFNAFNSGNHGWVRVSKSNPHYFDYDDGTPYYGLGQNRPWHIEQAVNIFSKMSTNGMNVLGYWFVSWDNRLATMTTGYDRYDTSLANTIDGLVDTCERCNIQLYLAVWAHPDLRDLAHSWADGRWESDNPFQLIPCTATTFFTNSTSWQYQQNLYRYIIARWGYSRAIGWWHTITEIDGTCAYSNDSAWHYKINDYFQKNDPFRHPTTASKSNGLWSQGFIWMDSPQVHIYGENNAADSTRVSGAMAIRTQQMWSQYSTKPNVIGEFGTQTLNSQPTHQHNATWAGVCTGAAIAPLVWHDGGSWGDMLSAEYATMKAVRAFVSDIPFSKLNLQPATISVNSSSIAVYGMKDTAFCYFWIQDSTPTRTITGLRTIVSGLNNGTYRVYWWNTWSGTTIFVKTEYVTNGIMTTYAPTFTKDIAAKVYRITDAIAVASTFWDFDISNESWISGVSTGSATILSGPIQVETPTHPVTNNGSIYYTFNLNSSASWSDIKGRSPSLGGLDWSNYNSFTAYIYLPPGAPTLQAKLYTESGTNTTWQEPASFTSVPPDTWTALVLNKSDIADPTKYQTFGFKIGSTTANYTNGTVYFDYVNGYGYSYLPNPMGLALVGGTSLLIGDTCNLMASGGYQPYTWSVVTIWSYTGASPGTLNSYSNPTVTFTALAIGTCYITVTDVLGQVQNSALISVSPYPLSLTLSGSTTLLMNDTRQLSAANGYPPYSWTIVTTSGIPGYLNVYAGATVTFTAVSSGSCNIQVSDFYGNTNSVDLVVSLSPLVLTMNGSPIISIGQTRQLIASDGYPSYQWSIITTSGSPGYLNAYTGATVIFNTAGIGTCYISVTDSYLQTQNSPTLIVTATDAPLVPEPESIIPSRSNQMGELFPE